jgi:hypothetical protein
MDKASKRSRVQGNGIARDKLHARDEQLYIVDMYNRDVYPNDLYAQRGVDYPVRLACCMSYVALHAERGHRGSRLPAAPR